jgi:hypothetical protein
VVGTGWLLAPGLSARDEPLGSGCAGHSGEEEGGVTSMIRPSWELQISVPASTRSSCEAIASNRRGETGAEGG